MFTAASTFVTKNARNWRCFDVNAFRTGVVGFLGAANVNSWNVIPLDDLVEYYDSTITSLLDRLAQVASRHFAFGHEIFGSSTTARL